MCNQKRLSRTRAPAWSLACFPSLLFVQQLGQVLFTSKANPNHQHRQVWELHLTAQIEFSFYERYFNP